MSEWFPRSDYEVAIINRTYYVLVRGGVWQTNEPSFWVQATAPDRDEAYRIRDALRATLEVEQ
jgi:hypothetical protein